MAKLWCLVAHGSAGKILAIEKAGNEIHVVKEFHHSQTAKKGEELTTDRPGRTFDSAGTARHAMDPGENPKEHELKVFAKELADFLEKSYVQNVFSELILVASPNLLGELRKNLSTSVKNCLKGEVGKDLYSLPESNQELMEKIRDDLNLATL